MLNHDVWCYCHSTLCCSDGAAETDTCSSPVHKDIVSDGSDSACHAMDAEYGEAATDMSMQDTPTHDAVDSTAADTEVNDETTQPGDEAQTGDVSKQDEDVQPTGNAVDHRPTWYFADIIKQWRRFNIDLMPKVIKSLMIC